MRTLLKPFELGELEQLLGGIHTGLASVSDLIPAAWRHLSLTASFSFRAANKTLLASLLCLVVLLSLPATQRLARTASLSFVSRSYAFACADLPALGWFGLP